MDDGHNDSQRRLRLEIALLGQRLEAAEDMYRAITGDEVDGFVVGGTDAARRVRLLEGAHIHYGQIVDRMQQAALTVSIAGEILYANERLAAMLGEPLVKLFSALLQHYIADADRLRLETFLLEGVADSSVEVTLRRRDGGTVLTRLALASFGDGYASLLVTDLTAREHMEEAQHTLEAIRNADIDGVVIGGEELVLLRGAHRPYAAMVDRMHQGALTVSADTEVLYANDRFISMVGIARERVLGRRLDSFFLPSDRATLQHILEQARVASAQGELSVARPDGSALPVLVTGVPVEDAAAVNLILTDLTEQRRYRAIENAGRHKDEFLAVLAHELRNPLAPIRHAVQVLQSTPELAANARQVVDIIARQSATLARLIDDLIDINRLNQGKIRLEKRPLDVKAVIESAVEAVRPLLQERRHTLDVELPPEAVHVEGDAVRLSQVILNLLSNAAKYTPQGGQVRVVLRQEGGSASDARAVIRVMDTGIGIPENLLREIFEPYVQVSSPSLSGQGGLGLGLTVARRLVEMHHGSVTAHRRASGEGSEFVVELPLCAARPLADGVNDDTGPAAAASGLRILIADDNTDSARSLAMILSLSGHATKTASDGIEALRVAEEFRPQIALLDIGMPNLDGYATARKLRARPWAQQLALFALTGWGQPEDERRALDAGFNAHVVKPLDPHKLERLVEAVHRELHEGHQGASSVSYATSSVITPNSLPSSTPPKANLTGGT
jgi:PAS domain S-box-containing protein